MDIKRYMKVLAEHAVFFFVERESLHPRPPHFKDEVVPFDRLAPLLNSERKANV